jgi:hypothetical protein
MREQMLELGAPAPDMSECPPDITDFPPLVEISMEIFGMLQDDIIIAPDGSSRYKGKIMSNIETLFDIYYIKDRSDKKFILELISILDMRARKDLNRK